MVLLLRWRKDRGAENWRWRLGVCLFGSGLWLGTAVWLTGAMDLEANAARAWKLAVGSSVAAFALGVILGPGRYWVRVVLGTGAWLMAIVAGVSSPGGLAPLVSASVNAAACWAGLGALVVIGIWFLHTARHGGILGAPLAAAGLGRSAVWCELGAGALLLFATLCFADLLGLGGHRRMAYAVLALETETGKAVWRREVFHTRTESVRRINSLATPTPATDGRRVVAWFGPAGVICLSPDGQTIWTRPEIQCHLVASPVLADDRLLLAGGVEHRLVELPSQPGACGRVVWRVDSRGEISSSPVVSNGLVFLVTEQGRAACLDLEDGRTLWEKKLSGRFFASVTAVGTAVHFCNERGRTFVVSQNRNLQELAQNDVGEAVYASSAPALDRLFVRSSGRLLCLGVAGDQQPATIVE